MKFLHAADIHLDSPLHGLEAYADAPLGQLRSATRRAFDNLIDLAIAEQVAFLLIAGDLYDGDWKDYNTGLFLANRLGRLRKEGIRVFLVSGNHDAASQISKSLVLPDNVHLFSTQAPETVRIEELRVALHGQGYETRGVADNLASGFPLALPHYFNIGLLHTSLTGRQGHEPYAPCSLDDLRSKGYAYWALGHIHKREEVCREPWVVFPGNIQGRHIQESGDKGATLVTVREGGVVAVEHRSLDVLRWLYCPLDISDCSDLSMVEEAVRLRFASLEEEAAERPLAIRLSLVGESMLHSRLHGHSFSLNESFRGLAAGFGDLWLEKVLFATESTAELDAAFGEDSPLADLVKNIARLDLGSSHLIEALPELAALKSKLPPELQQHGQGLFADDAARRAELCEEVKALLLAGLLKEGRGR
ncbi:metallophosphoesterase family protein [Thiovibrio sp. JS02]